MTIVTIIIALAYIACEAFYNYYSILDLANSKHSGKWHFWNALAYCVFAFVLVDRQYQVFGTAIIPIDIDILPIALASYCKLLWLRWFAFDLMLNLLRGLTPFYIGTTARIDKAIRKLNHIFAPWMPVEWFVLFVKVLVLVLLILGAKLLPINTV